MSPRSRPGFGAAPRRSPRRPRGAAFRWPVVVLAAAIAALALLAGCSASFDPNGPCTADGSVAGAYPDLEAQVPRDFRGTPPAEVDSGRACTADGLGTLQGHGITELRFGGSTWSTGTQSGLSLAVFRSQGAVALTRDWLVEFYETGAKAGKDVTSVDTTDYPVAPNVAGRRIDVLNGESYQSIVVWESQGRIETAIVADFIREIQTRAAHDAVVRDAVDAWTKAAPTAS